jgi:hypothetical protein
MVDRKLQTDATLLDVLIDGFEKNEVVHGYHWRDLPLPDEDAALAKFAQLAEEARRWKGTPTRAHEEGGRRVIGWPDLEIRQAGRGILVRARAPGFADWWHDRETWAGDPLGPVHEWIDERRGDG